MNLKLLKAALLLSATFGTGCIHRSAAQEPVTPRINAPAGPTSPDAAFRAIFKQQMQNAVDPLNDDSQVHELKARLKADSRDAKARLELAFVYENYRLYDNALNEYMEATRQLAAGDPLLEQAALGLGRTARASRNRAAEALPVLETAAKQLSSVNLWTEVGLVSEQTGRLPDAQKAFEGAIAANPGSDSAHNYLGYSLLLQQRPEPAEAEFRKALELNPASATARNNLATTLARRGDRAGALEQFQMNGDAATAHNNLAVVLLEIGRYEESREELVKALSIRHNFPPAFANFKVVQEKIREQADVQKYGRLPLNAVRVPSALVASGKEIPAGTISTESPEVASPKFSEDAK